MRKYRREKMDKKGRRQKEKEVKRGRSRREEGEEGC